MYSCMSSFPFLPIQMWKKNYLKNVFKKYVNCYAIKIKMILSRFLLASWLPHSVMLAPIRNSWVTYTLFDSLLLITCSPWETKLQFLLVLRCTRCMFLYTRNSLPPKPHRKAPQIMVRIIISSICIASSSNFFSEKNDISICIAWWLLGSPRHF